MMSKDVVTIHYDIAWTKAMVARIKTLSKSMLQQKEGGEKVKV
jgi:hypothetical protein